MDIRYVAFLPQMLVLVLLAGCDPVPGGPLDLSGDAPAAAGAEIAQGFCDRHATCGIPEWNCHRQPDGSEECVGLIRALDPEVDCVGEAASGWDWLLTCAMPSPTEWRAIETCVNEGLSEPCLTQEDVDAVAEQIERDELPDDESAACRLTTAVFDRCLPGPPAP